MDAAILPATIRLQEVYWLDVNAKSWASMQEVHGPYQRPKRRPPYVAYVFHSVQKQLTKLVAQVSAIRRFVP